MSPAPLVDLSIAHRRDDTSPTVANLLRLVDELSKQSYAIPEDGELIWVDLLRFREGQIQRKWRPQARLGPHERQAALVASASSLLTYNPLAVGSLFTMQNRRAMANWART